MLREFDSVRGTKSRRRRSLAFVSLLWLNIAMLPCAMAMEDVDFCPDCPPEHEQAMAAHHGTQHAHETASCIVEQADCCELDQISVDSQPQKSDKPDAHGLVAITTLQNVSEVRAPDAHRYATGPPGQAGNPRRLHEILCVYLD